MEWVKKKLQRKRAHGRDTTKPTPLLIPTTSPQGIGYGIQEPSPDSPHDHGHVHGHSPRLSGRLRVDILPPRHPYPPLGSSAMIATLFGFNRPNGRVQLAVQTDGPRSGVLTVLQLAITTDRFADALAAGPLEFVLRCGRSLDGARPYVWQEPTWVETCNDVSHGEAGLSAHGVRPYVLQLLESMVLGVGLVAEYEDRGMTGELMYIRAPVQRSQKATEDYERLHLVQLDELGFHDLTFVFLRE